MEDFITVHHEMGHVRQFIITESNDNSYYGFV